MKRPSNECSGNGTEGSGACEAMYKEDGRPGREYSLLLACPHPAFPEDLNKKYIYIKNIMKNKKTFSPNNAEHQKEIFINYEREILAIKW
jgi:hypothetical protein